MGLQDADAAAGDVNFDNAGVRAYRVQELRRHTILGHRVAVDRHRATVQCGGARFDVVRVFFELFQGYHAGVVVFDWVAGDD